MLSSDHPSGQAGPGESGETVPLIPGHELLRQIARGGYGEIWLARTELGVFRAVKIVRQARFADARPYDREFSGIQRYEPVSREHEGLVDVLQVGQDEAAGFFYYVMELADDAPGDAGNAKSEIRNPKSAAAADTNIGHRSSAIGHWQAYTPRTLAHVIRQRGHLPVSEVIELGIGLARALEFLHSRRLVHRDVKPSNIIFVGGQPKLADVGLVADLGNPQSLVGTEGYIPPEGPGSAQADIYSLGKVLYEAATGKDRQEFPDLPTRLGQGHDDPALPELNEVLLKACESQPRARYRSAGEMAADLERLKAGQSLRSRRARRRLHKKLVLVAALIAPVAVAVWFAHERNTRHGLTVRQEYSKQQVATWIAATPAHWDNLPGKDLLVTQGNDLLGFDSAGRLLVRWSCPEAAAKSVHVSMVGDLDSDGQDEAFVSWTAGTNCVISEIRQTGWERLPRFQARGRDLVEKNLGATSSLITALLLPAKESYDGRRKLFASLATFSGGSPRALCCFDYESRTQCWQQSVAPLLRSIQSADLNGDGQPELLAGSVAVKNGNALPDGTDDRHSYIYAFSLSGEPLWHRELAGEFTASSVLVRQYETGKPPRIYAWISGKAGPKWQAPPHGSVVELGVGGEILHKFPHELPLLSAIQADLGGDATHDLLVADADGFVFQLSPDLQIKASRQVVPGALEVGTYDEKRPLLLKVGVLAPGRRPEVVLQSSLIRQRSWTNFGDNSQPGDDYWTESADIMVLRSSLETAFSYPVARQAGNLFNWSTITADTDGDGYHEILSLTDKVTILKRNRSLFGIPP